MKSGQNKLLTLGAVHSGDSGPKSVQISLSTNQNRFKLAHFKRYLISGLALAATVVESVNSFKFCVSVQDTPRDVGGTCLD